MSEVTSERGGKCPSETPEKQTVEVSSLRNLAAQWQTLEYGEQIKKRILKDETLDRIRKATQLIMESTCKPDETCGGGNIEKMEWDSLYDFSANIMDNYTKSVDSTLTQLDQLYRQQYLWQESAFVVDSHRGATLIGKAEEWMKLKENHLDFKKGELDRSANVIKSTIERLTTEK